MCFSFRSHISRWSLRQFSVICLLLAVLTGFATPSPVLAQEDAATGTGQIEGRILNAQTGRYMNRALVRVEGTNLQVFTNQFGEYRLYGVPVGTARLRATFTGMQPQTAQVDVIANETAIQDFTFRSRVAEGGEDGEEFELEDLVVRSSDIFRTASEIAIQEERFSVNLKNVVDTDAYGIIAQGNVGEFVKFIPGVTIGYGGSGVAGGSYASGEDANTISIRGYSARETSITIDGMGIANAAPGTLDPAVGLDMMSINNAARVEVIKVPTPDQPNAGIGGTVNLVSRTAFEYPRPTGNIRVYLTMNSEQLDSLFKKTPGPMNKHTYKTLPSVSMNYALPINERVGFSLSLSSDNQASVGHVLKPRINRNPNSNRPTHRPLSGPTSTVNINGETSHYWLQEDVRFSGWQQQYGDDWTQWSEADFREMYGITDDSSPADLTNFNLIKRIPRYDSSDTLLGAWSPEDALSYETLPVYYDADGNQIGRVYNDWAHPYIHRVQITDSPRISHRHSAALKMDWRPFDGVLVAMNYQISAFEDASARRRVHQLSGYPSAFGPDWVESYDGGVRLDTDAFGREGTTQSAYVKASYIKGPWNVSGHLSHSWSRSDLVSAEKGHFSVVEVGMGGVDFTEFLDISRDGVPQKINFYRDIRDEEDNIISRELIDITDLSQYNINGFDPSNPQEGSLRVSAAGINSQSTITTAKFDVRRDLDFIPGQFMNLAIKAGIDFEEREEKKGGRGTGYSWLYLGQEGRILDIGDFVDQSYVGVDSGFGIGAIQWPDPYALYSYMLNNPGSFSDTDDRVPAGGGRSVAAENWMPNTSKGITETKIGYYGQLEGNFFNNRLSIVGGFRMSERERKGFDRGENRNWRNLHFDRDETGDGLRDVFVDYTDIDIDPIYEVTSLGRFDVTGPALLLQAYRGAGVSSFEELSPFLQDAIMTWYRYYEQAGAVYADGEPFIASEFVPIVEGTLRATQLQYIKDFPIKENSVSRPQPIISAAYDITQRLVGRLSWATTYSNPPFESSEGAGGTLRRVVYNENADRTGSMTVTNPALKISKTTSWDAGLSYYTDTGGKFGLNVYYATENDRPIRRVLTIENAPEAWLALMEGLGHGPNSIYRREGLEWPASTDVNAQGTFVNYGYELEARQDLAILGGWGRYFYIYGSVSQQFQKAGEVPEDEEGEFNISQSDEKRINASGGVSFNYRRLILRVNATWRNERTSGITNGVFWEDPTIGNPGWFTATPDDDEPTEHYRQLRLINPADLRIDLNASYRLTDRYTIDFSARNITQSNPEPQYVLEGPGKLPRYGQIRDGTDKSAFGINFTLGLSAKF